jgi:hypothetical protein
VYGFGGGDGSAGAPYQVATAGHLDDVRNHLGAHFVQTADISLGAPEWSGGAGWAPIGTSAVPFAGLYDGGGFAIQNLKILRSETNYCGLFGYLNGATVRSLDLENADVRGAQYSGGLAGMANATQLENIHATGSVVGGSDTGGLVGRLASACDVNFVSFAGSVAGGSNTGGLVGSTSSANSIRHAWTIGSVQGGSHTGGLIGYFRVSASGTNCSLADAFSQASVAGTSNVGGAIGYAYYSNVSRVYSSGAVSATGTNVGGFLGVAGSAGTLRDCYWDLESSGQLTSAGGSSVTGLVSAAMRQRASFHNFNFFTAWQIDEGQDAPAFRDLGVHAGPVAITLGELNGIGTAELPYLITNADELHAMRLALAAHYRLANDIDLGASVMWDAGRGWIPVGTSTVGQRFIGTLDGAGFAIRNLTINRPPASYQGLFGFLDGAVVRNLRLEDASVRGDQFSGTLAGLANATLIENIRANGELSGGSDTGGLVGRLATACNVNHVSFVGSVAGGANTGGLAGSTSNGNSIRHAWTIGSVRGGNHTGGLIGYFRISYSGANCSLADAYSRASVSGTSHVGGAIGYAYYSNVSRVYSSGAVTGTGSNVGGFLGVSTTSALRDCHWDVERSGLAASAGGAGVIGQTTRAMRQKGSFHNFNFFTLWRIDEGVDYPQFQDPGVLMAPATLALVDLEGEGTDELPYLIHSADELHAMRLDLGAHYRLENDIDLSDSVFRDAGRGWIPAGLSSSEPFVGTLDGAGHTIRNLTVNRPPDSYQGLFGYLAGAEVRNLRIENASIRGNQYTAILAGYADGALIEHVHASGEISGGGDTGGLVGRLASACDVNHVSFAGSVAGDSNTGGLAGSTTSGNRIRHAWTIGSVRGGMQTGGLIGYFRHSSIGTNCSLADSYSRASVAGTSNVGGAIGYAYYSNVSRVYSSGAVWGTGTNVGGFLGLAGTSSALRDCYWDIDGSGWETSAGGAAVTGHGFAAMRQRASFHNFNFFTTWRIADGVDSPEIRYLGVYSAPEALTASDLAGEGTAESPYLISSADEFNAMRTARAAHYRLTNDIDLSESVAWDAGRGWIPIGALATGQRFTGALDGGGHTIRNLAVNRPPDAYQGLFGYLDGAEVRNLRIENASIRGNQYTAILAGFANGSLIENVHAGGEISGGSDTGGLVGRLSSACDVNHVSFTGSVAGDNNTGGLVGSTSSGNSIRHAWTIGSVQGGSHTGGLIGNCRTSSSGTNCSLADAYSRAWVSGTSNVGGAIGYAYYINVSRVYSSGAVSATGTNVGGFLGAASSGSTLRDCYWDIDGSGRPTSAGGVAVTGLVSTAMRQRSSFHNFNFFTAWHIDEGLDAPVFRDLGVHAGPVAVVLNDLVGDGTAESPYLITNADELNAMRLALAAHYRLTNDIDLGASVMWDAGRGWIPVGTSTAGQRFIGTLDGAGFAIRNLTINRPPASYQGLFGYLDGAEVRNLRLEDASVRGDQFSGTLAGLANATLIENIRANGELSGGSDTGGLVGRLATACNVNHVSFAGSVAGGANTGGLVGSTASANSIRHAWTIGSVRGASYTGGLVGHFRTTTSGTNCSLADAYSRASVSGTTNVGGAIGYQYYSNVSRVYSSGTVTGTGSNVGGFLGATGSSSSQSNCYWDVESSGSETSAGGAGVSGRTTQQMKQQATFGGWNFTEVWNIEPNLGYPYHRQAPPDMALSPAERHHHNGASTGHRIEVVTNVAWTAVADDAWISITGGANGRDVGTITYSVAANPSPAMRTGTITLSDGAMVRTFTVTQAASLAVMPDWAHHDSPASAGHQFAVAGNMAWSATSGLPWIEVTGGASGSGAGTVTYRVAHNHSLDPREGVILVSGGGIERQFNIIQGGAAPYLGISPEWAEHPAEGTNTRAIAVTANMAWTATSDSPWITLAGGGGGTGDGTVTYQVAATGDHSLRVGHVTVSDGTRTLRHRVFQVPQGSVRIDIIDSPSGAGHFAGFGQYRTGERVTLDAWDSASHTFVSWSDGAGVVSTHPQLVFTAQAPRTLTANYELRVHTLVYHGSGEGWIQGDPLQFVQHGSNGSPVRAVPNSGHVFIEWSDGVTANPRTDTNVSSYIEVTALFLEIPEGHHALVYLAGEGGGIDGISPQIVESGGTGAPVGVVPTAGTAFHQWSDGSTANPRTDENVQADIEVTAHFRSLGGVDIDWYVTHGIFPGDGQTWADLDVTDRFGKGMTLREEFLAKTDPNDPQSRFVTDAPVRVGTTVEIHFQPSSPDRRYTLWRSTDLADWSSVPGQVNVPGGSGPLIDDTPPVRNAFYRVAAGLP